VFNKEKFEEGKRYSETTRAKKNNMKKKKEEKWSQVTNCFLTSNSDEMNISIE